MKASSFQAICEALMAANVRFLVAGGLAVNAHGYLRFTKDADLVIELVPESILKAFSALEAIGYRPNVPISANQMADPSFRRRCVEEKNMQVLQFWSDAHRDTPLDVFVEHPFDFDREYEAAPRKPLSGAGDVAYVTLATLIAMKEKAGRPQDLIDVRELQSKEKPDA